MTHLRNTGPMLASPRCGARTRSGEPCMSPAVSGKSRCRMHGGAPGTGAPQGNQNALKHGRYTCEAIAERELCENTIIVSPALVCSTFAAVSYRFSRDALADLPGPAFAVGLDSLIGFTNSAAAALLRRTPG